MTTIDNRFVPLPVWLLEADVTPGALKLYAWLGKYANWDDGLCYPSRATLAERVGVKSARTIDGYIKELVAAGAITVRHRTDDKGDPTSNEYHVITARPSGEGVAQSVAPPRAVDCARGSAVDCSLPRTTLNEDKNIGDDVADTLDLGIEDKPAPKAKTAKGDKGYTPDFEEWWARYPRSDNKAAASKAYATARKNLTATELLNLLGRWLRHRELEASRRPDGWAPVLPYGASWLNARRWEELPNGAQSTPGQAPTAAPELGQDDVDRILGRDYWTPPAPPAGLDLLAERQWRADRVAEHQAARRQAALARLTA